MLRASCVDLRVFVFIFHLFLFLLFFVFYFLITNNVVVVVVDGSSSCTRTLNETRMNKTKRKVEHNKQVKKR